MENRLFSLRLYGIKVIIINYYCPTSIESEIKRHFYPYNI